MAHYTVMSKEDLMIERYRLREQLSFHAHADRMSFEESQKMAECQRELGLIRDEFARRKEIGDNVLAKLNTLKERWTP
jgi:hypothetical protein